MEPKTNNDKSVTWKWLAITCCLGLFSFVGSLLWHLSSEVQIIKDTATNEAKLIRQEKVDIYQYKQDLARLEGKLDLLINIHLKK